MSRIVAAALTAIGYVLVAFGVLPILALAMLFAGAVRVVRWADRQIYFGGDVKAQHKADWRLS